MIDSAGFAAEFISVIGTPLTGVIFSVEGANGKFPPYIILSGVVGGFFCKFNWFDSLFFI